MIKTTIRDEKLKYNSNREAAKTSALSSGKKYKYKYLKGEKMLPSYKSRAIKFYFFFFTKSFWNTNKINWKPRRRAIEEQGK